MSNKVLGLIQPISKKDQVVIAIRDAVLSGAIQPGEAIVESKIAQQLGAGIPLVREALIDLEYQGYVQKTPYKGTTVTKLSPEDIEQIFRLRVELEALAVEWATPHLTPVDLEEFRELVSKMQRAAQQLDLDRFYENDLAFHRKLWALSGNTYLVNALERVVPPLFAFFLMKTTRQRESYLESAEVHLQIVEAFSRMDAAGIRQLMKESVAAWRDDMLKLLFPEK
ncbi:MAG TPA: GntR family transcriptional regulator [Blastocatellia bacterium]|nr:GntR family transcriptional regulator [Blastocatellia bacterium]